VTIENNIIESNSLAGIAVSGEGHQITGNTLRNNGVPSWENAQIIFFASFGENASNCTVTNNTMEAGANQTLVSVLNGFVTEGSPHTINNNRYCSINPSPFCWGALECSNPLDFYSLKIQSGHDVSSTFNAASCSASDPTPTPGKSISGIYLLLLK
jgi:parallel beta-helix repeat protein